MPTPWLLPLTRPSAPAPESRPKPSSKGRLLNTTLVPGTRPKRKRPRVVVLQLFYKEHAQTNGVLRSTRIHQNRPKPNLLAITEIHNDQFNLGFEKYGPITGVARPASVFRLLVLVRFVWVGWRRRRNTRGRRRPRRRQRTKKVHAPSQRSVFA